MAITLSGTNGITTPDVNSDGLTVDTTTLVVDEANNRVGVGTSSPSYKFHLVQPSSDNALVIDNGGGAGDNTNPYLAFSGTSAGSNYIRGRIRGTLPNSTDGGLAFDTGSSGSMSERARIDSSGNFMVGTTNTAPSSSNVIGVSFQPDIGRGNFSSSSHAVDVNRTADGNLIVFRSTGTSEGAISVSGTTTSYNGGHLARWSQLADNTKDETILKGTVMTNLDQMAEWTTDGVTEANEQLNCMAVSSVEGDPNVAGVFVNWDNDDDVYTNDMNIAMTGDMIIRIAAGTTVARGDLLMSAGDGTAKPQGDDIVRSKTIAKVTSTHVTCTYDDGSYCVPCVLMAC